jgi:hypothetical protein
MLEFSLESRSCQEENSSEENSSSSSGCWTQRHARLMRQESLRARYEHECSDRRMSEGKERAAQATRKANAERDADVYRKHKESRPI